MIRLAPLAGSLLTGLILAAVSPAQHWSFVPPQRPALVGDQQPIDELVARPWQAVGLQPSPRAEDAVLVRRLSLDLTGLPATPADLAVLRAVPGEEGWLQLVDRMLESPAHAERMAAVWLDLARYADSKGYGSDPLRTIYRYRDWVIDAYRQNMPFDEFTVLQMAGDLLPDATWREQLATAFHRNTMTNTEGGTDDEEFRVEAVRDRVDTTMSVWMGLTAGCAKCHDHKFDPLSQREYYQLVDYFNHTADRDRGNDEPKVATPTAEQERQLAVLEQRGQSLQLRLDERRARLGDVVEDWAEWRRSADAAWRLVTPVEASTTSATQLLVDDAGWVVAQGPAAERDRYRLEFADLSGPVATLRLDLGLGDERATVGRRPGNGNVVLSELRVGVRNVSSPSAVRYVRVELPGRRRILSLAEVEVLDAAGGNLARGAAARQSSTDYDGPARLAVDGDTDGAHENGSVTHTRTEDDPWWEVDLGADREVARVRLWNRTGGSLPDRLQGARLLLLDAARRPLWRGALERVPTPSLAVELADAVQWRSLAAPAASFEQTDWTAAKAIDGDAGTGWAVSPQQNRPHRASWRLAAPVQLRAGERLVVEMDQSYGGHHVIARHRWWTHESPLDVLPEAAARAVLTPAAERDAGGQQALEEVYARFDPRLAKLRTELDQLAAERKQVGLARTAVLQELPEQQRRETHVMMRGNFLSPGAEVSAATPTAFHPFPDDAPQDRLGFARWLVDRRNPLTARVQMNRLWAHLFGVGLVATEEDFGTQGEAPSNQPLLDWLAVEFMESGWDLRHMLRTIVRSETYRRAAAPARPEDRPLDPQNRLLARGARFRLEAEMVRDQALDFAGLLSRKVGGPSVYPPQPDGLWQAAFNSQRSWRTSEGEDRYRRAIYTFIRRSSPYPSMIAFDAPTREICTLRRVRTNTPLQAFVTLNDPVFVEAAQALARRIVEGGGATPTERIRWALHQLLLREDLETEAAVLAGLFEQELAHYRERPADARRLATEPLGPLPDGADAVEYAAWTVVANALLNFDGLLVRP